MTRRAGICLRLAAAALLLGGVLTMTKRCGGEDYRPPPDRWLQE